MKPAAVVVSLLAMLGLAIVGVHHVWTELDGVTISTHGLIALGLGVFLTFALGAGLMFLVFYSNRHGYDDTVVPPPGSDRDRDL